MKHFQNQWPIFCVNWKSDLYECFISAAILFGPGLATLHNTQSKFCSWFQSLNFFYIYQEVGPFGSFGGKSCPDPRSIRHHWCRGSPSARVRTPGGAEVRVKPESPLHSLLGPDPGPNFLHLDPVPKINKKKKFIRV